ncbi:MAG: hypothetical protein VZR53_18195 [Prevotella sp.]|jgi:hypothetical protein|nr:hypothetical protein [Prevotella sp.]
MENLELEKQQVAPVNNFYGNINNFKVYNGPVNFYGPEYNNNGIEEEKSTDTVQDGKIASEEMMIKAAKITQRNGLWKSQRSWSVMFMVYCIWGYKGRVTDFLNDVMDWPEEVTSQIVCNRYAVEKLKNTYNFSKEISEWRSNGVPEQYCILGEQLDEELTKMTLDMEQK